MTQTDPKQPHMSRLDHILKAWRVDTVKGKVYNSKGGEVATLHNSGYLVGCVLGQQILLHHIIWFVHYGKWPTKQLDHKDRNKRNNRIDNLREVLHSIQMSNREVEDPEMRGIRFSDGKYEVRISIKGKTSYLGRYETAEEARKVFDNKRNESQGV